MKNRSRDAMQLTLKSETGCVQLEQTNNNRKKRHKSRTEKRTGSEENM